MGSELLSINNHPISLILESMFPYIPNDAHIRTSKYRKLEGAAYFGRLFNLIYGTSPIILLYSWISAIIIFSRVRR